MTYKFKYKRGFFWKTVKNVKGHSLDATLNRMDIFTNDAIISISEWSKCDMKLGSDFLLFQKDEMSKEAGQDVKVSGVQ